MKTKTFKVVVADAHETTDESLDILGWKEEIKEALMNHYITLIKIEEVSNETT